MPEIISEIGEMEYKHLISSLYRVVSLIKVFNQNPQFQHLNTLAVQGWSSSEHQPRWSGGHWTMLRVDFGWFAHHKRSFAQFYGCFTHVRESYFARIICFADKPTRGQSGRGLVTSRTSRLAEMFDLKFGIYNKSVISDRLHYLYAANTR